MLLYSWNVNGFRACVGHGFYKFLSKRKPDILGIQEIKYHTKPLEPEGYHVVWYPAKKKGYSGTAVFVKDTLDFAYIKGMDDSVFDGEGRVLTLEMNSFYFVDVYFPNSQHGLTRLDFKMRFNNAFKTFVDGLNKKKPVIICGDFNVAHKEIDIARPKSNVGNPGFTDEERNWMTEFLSNGYVDTYRYLHPDTVKYSWWSYRFNARKKNIGWRIDYFITSKQLTQYITRSEIATDVYGSDHAPILLDISLRL